MADTLTSDTEPSAGERSRGEPDPPGRRQRKKRQTRADLMREAARLFAANGFDETTTEDIAEAADLSQRTFFRHFPSKEAVLYADMDDLRQRVRRALVERPADEPVMVSVREAILALADDFEAEADLRFLQAKLAAAYPSVSAYSRAVVQAQWERELVEVISGRLGVDPLVDARPEILAGAAMSALRTSIRRWTASDGQLDLPEVVARAFDDLARLSELAQPDPARRAAPSAQPAHSDHAGRSAAASPAGGAGRSD